MSHGLLAMIKASEKFIRAQTGMGLMNLQQACATRVEHLSDLIRKSSGIDQSELTDVFEYLQEDNGTFNVDQRSSIAKLAQARCNTLDQCGAAGDEDNQDNLFLMYYYPDWLWSILKSDDTMNNKLTHTGEFLVKHLGIRHASATTKRLAVAIAQVASNDDIDPDKGYSQVHDLQAVIVRKRNNIPGAATLKTFPKDPNEFWTQYPTSYTASHPPAPCRVDESKVTERNCKSCIPTRCTNAKVSGKQTTKSYNKGIPQVANQTDVIGNTMQMMMKFMMCNNAAGAPPRDCGPRSNPSLTDQPQSPNHHGQQLTANTDVHDRHVAPDDAGGLPGCLKPPHMKGSSAEQMQQIRADIQAAVAKQPKSKTKGKTPSQESDDDAASSQDSRELGDTTQKKKAKKKKKKKKKKKQTKKDANRSKKDKKQTSEKKKSRIAKHDWKENEAAAKLLKRPASCPRPKFSTKPTQHGGGRLYFAKARHCFRVYLRSKDRIETTVPILDDQKAAFRYSCALIESDPRPK